MPPFVISFEIWGVGCNGVQDISKHYELLHFLKDNNEKEDKSADSASIIL